MAKRDLFRGVVLGAVVSTLVLAAATAMAGTGVGAVFNLGRTNSVDAQSILRGEVAGRSLQITNTGTGAGLGITVEGGNPPIVVDPSAGKATNLNADELDGLSSTAFLRAGQLLEISGRLRHGDPDETILRAGPFRIMAHCQLNGEQIFQRAFLRTTRNDTAVRGTDMFDTDHGDTDFDIGDELTINQYQESGTPPPPTGPFEATMNMLTPSGQQIFVTITMGTHLFSNNASERTDCVFAGYAIVT
jgi:hypothetical protein